MSIEEQSGQTPIEKRVDVADDIAQSLIKRVFSIENLSDEEKAALLDGIGEIRNILEKIRDSSL
ncbi:MAG: hypothetical protein A3H51_01100 [Candidatus Spechtbacteria bacterium RIFCSPLOWO2_02_FULL_38_8]|uniref:Uncharacterized protein n=1 Tax=Candidatus Spechtbacteria bacterium RIFCSPLOWO2_02_FULL_38_8 TaxID=1802164 RepID=A0A1G2HKQ8_9BACT|nr:MAG: hypothetical protein A3H51_01100 [Candidatus Spechtbacteria bacterium RIFCSPLOWO2_02_FULL_38_8]